MPSALFECPVCKEQNKCSFTVGKQSDLVCPKCGTKLQRVFTPNVGIGEVVTDKMISVDYAMLYSQTDNKKDKDFF